MADKVDKLRVGDARATKRFTEVKGRKWYYLDAPSTHPSGQKHTIFLIHGFPDISFTWRYQIPLLTSLGFRCIALDCMGYASTGASPNLADYSFKSHADAIAGIAAENKISRAAIGGHDWGGILVYRVAQWYPNLISHIFSVCTAFVPVNEGKFVSTKDLAAGVLPQFGYQLQFGSEDGEVERAVDGKERRLRKFLNGLYGGKVGGGKKFMDPRKGVELDLVRSDANDAVGKTPLMSDEEIDYYVSEFSKFGIHGPCNWYRTRKINYDEEKNMPVESRKIIKQPTLYILATKDDVLTREMSRGMEKTVPNLTRGEVPAGHWALWQTPDQVNAILKDWIEGVVLGGKSKL